MCHSDLVREYSRKVVETIANRALRHHVTLYSLYRKVNGKYIRVSDMAYTEKLACRVFSERLSFNPLELSIRPIKIESLEAK